MAGNFIISIKKNNSNKNEILETKNKNFKI